MSKEELGGEVVQGKREGDVRGKYLSSFQTGLLTTVSDEREGGRAAKLREVAITERGLG